MAVKGDGVERPQLNSITLQIHGNMEPFPRGRNSSSQRQTAIQKEHTSRTMITTRSPLGRTLW